MNRSRLPLYLTGAAAATTVVSIAAFETLLGLAFVAWAITCFTDHRDARLAWRWPPVTIPLFLWFAATLISAAASGHAHDALPQVRKFYVFLMLFLVFTVFRKVSEIRSLVIAWAVAAAASSIWSFVQLAHKYQAAQAAHEDFYLAYVASRITGFMGHWMTFSGQMMIALMLIGALVFFSRDSHGKPWLIAAGVMIAGALLAAYTRSMWLGAMIGGAYLIWMWRRWLILAIPVVIAIVLLANPFAVRERALSIYHPHGDTDSNEHRAVTRRIGWEMIKAHPWLGLGPEEVGKQYLQYIPADVPRPLPTGYYGHLHNIYIHYAAERGVPAMLALLWFLLNALSDFARALRRAPAGDSRRWILQGAIAVTIAVMISGWYELNLGDSEVLGMFLAVVACGYVAVVCDGSKDEVGQAGSLRRADSPPVIGAG